MRLLLQTSAIRPAGEMARFAGISIQDPEREDAGGDRIYEHPDLSRRFKTMPVGVIRSCGAGTDTYSFTSLDDTRLAALRESWLPLFPHAEHDFSVSPAFDAADVAALFTARTGQVSWANEWPGNTGGLGEDAFVDTAAAIDGMEAHMAAAGKLRSYWRQQGCKPEFTEDNPNVSANLKTRHLAYKDAQIAAVQAGRLPRQFTSTMKIYDGEFFTDRYAEMLRRLSLWVDFYGPGTKVGFNEFKIGSDPTDEVTVDHTLACAEMFVMAPRLYLETGVMDRLIYQQGAAVGFQNLFFIDQDNAWNAGVHLYWWEAICDLLVNAEYVPSTVVGRVPLLNVECFRKGSQLHLAYVNKTSQDQPIDATGGQLLYMDDLVAPQTAPFTGTLPALSWGVVRWDPNGITT